MIDTIIFDGDGIVFDTEGIWDKGQEEFLRRRGFVYDRAKTKHLLTGKSLLEGVEVLKREYGFEGDSKELAQERLDLVKDRMEHEVQFVPGFKDFFALIKDKYKHCIASSMDENLLKIVDQRLGLSKLFGGRIYTLSRVGHRSKPNPDLFLYAANALSAQPKQCLVIEDSPYGITAAHRAGMKCIGMTTTYQREIMAEADKIVDTYAEIDLNEWAARA